MSSLFPTRGFRRTRERSSGLLFAFGVDDISETLPSGQTLSLTRATSRAVYDSAGRVITLARGQFPWSAHYNTTDAVWEPTLDAQDERTNLCLQSENFGTTWTAIGTPTRTAAAVTCGDLVLDLLGDDAAGTLEGYRQTITFTANAVKAVSLFVKAGTSTSAAIRLRDTTASADRLLARVQWSSGVPSVTMSNGTYIGATPCYGGVYRLLFRTSSVTAANTNQLEVYPATTAALAIANTGTIYAGGVQAENYDYPRMYVKTTTGTVTHNRDYLQSTFNFAPQTLTVYGRLTNPTWTGVTPLTDGPGVLRVGALGTNSELNIGRVGSSTTFRATILDSATTLLNADQTAPATAVFDFCAQFDALDTAPRVRLDVGSGFGSYSSVGAPLAAFSNSTLLVAGTSSTATGPSSVSAWNGGVRRLLIAPGLRTLAQMQGLAV